MTFTHLRTKIQSEFGVPDADGNVREPLTTTLELNILDEESWQNAFTLLKEFRQQVQETLTKALP